MLKKLFRNPIIQAILTRFIAFLIWFIGRTSRITFVGDGPIKEHLASGKPFILCFWHGRMLMCPYGWKVYPPAKASNRELHMMISAHGDGRFISKVISFFGVPTITGSTSRGGASALRNAVEILNQSKTVAITPDGPRGPRYKAAKGVVHAARLAECSIIPVSYSTTRHKIFNSWDHFYFPLPFSKLLIVLGDAIAPPTSEDSTETERVRLLVEAELNRVRELGDSLC